MSTYINTSMYQPVNTSIGSGLFNNLTSFYGDLYPSIFQNQSTSVNTSTYSAMAPQQNNSSSSNFMQQMVMMLLSSLLQPAQKEVVEEETVVTSSSWGDPHFTIAGQQSFDFQGNSNELYNMIDNKDISLNAKFGAWGDKGATVVKDQDLQFKDKNINLVTHANGKFEVYQNGKKIADETNYNKDEKAKEILKKSDVSLSLEGNVLKAAHGDRIISQKLAGESIDNMDDTIKSSDKGLLTQTAGALDNDFDGKTKMTVDVNKDGKVDEKDVLTYNARNQLMVHTAAAGTKSAPITAEIKAAIEKDIKAGLAKGSVVKGFSTEHGYDARQWNEYIGSKSYTVKKDKFLAA